MRWSASLRLLIWGLVLGGSFGAILGRAEEWQAKVSETGIPHMIDPRSLASELTHRVAAKSTILVHHFKALNPWVARAVLREFLAAGTRISARLQNSRLSQTLEVQLVKETCAHV